MNLCSIQISRFVLGLSWVYHGFFPKLFTIAPMERQLTATMGFSLEVSNWITRVAGAGEIVFGLLLITFYRSQLIHILNISALLGLLVFAAIMLPTILVEAFNPVTTNLALITLSCVILANSDSSNPP